MSVGCHVYRSGRHYVRNLELPKKEIYVTQGSKRILTKIDFFCGTGIAQKGNDLRTA
ncbi:hypothetical protein RirG_126990 [Rhizophagus irregularis DAOM 197198w]|uniref:Uncharacterized protein n=1 Tax=Rhizophagus irregularis (strain DAOM 197198w) TaxID=1432141 RepID=A0A015L188_RHIIW|nr:hypothetical protein RirG_126990 [Rhizophagus irregularis DAOM 197198w]